MKDPPRYDDGLPDLNAIPQDEWRAALAPLEQRERRRCVGRVATLDATGAALAVAVKLELFHDPPPRMREITPPPVPRATFAAPHVRSSQLNFRVSEGERAQVERAARLVGLRPTALARLLAVRGSADLIAELDR